MNEYTRQSPSKLPRGVTWATVEIYPYEDKSGRLWMKKTRQVAVYGGGREFINVNTGKPHKRCLQEWNGYSEKPPFAPPLLYCIENVRKAVTAGTTIFIVEGEPKVHALQKWGFAATCNEGGAEGWTEGHADVLRGPNTNIIILPDNDQAGCDHADDVGRSLINVTRSCRLLELPGLPDHGDIVDWIKAGGTKEQFEQLIPSAREWKPFGPPRKSTKEFEPECASEIPPEPVIWFWHNRIARKKVNVLFGPPETGKSNLGLYFVAKSTKGGEWPVDGHAPKGKWIVLSAEDDWGDTIVPRLLANGADLSQVFRLKMTGRWFDLTHDLPALRATIEKLGDVVGVFIDPATAFLSKPGKTDSHRQADVRAIMGPLGELAAELNLTIIVILHPNKDTKVSSVLAWISGSSAFGEYPRLVQMVIPNPEDEGETVLMLRAKNNNVSHSIETGLAFKLVETEVAAGISVPRVVWEEGEVTTTAKEAMDAYHRPDNDRKSASEVCDWLKALLLQGALPQKKIEEEGANAGISLDQLKRAKKKVGVESRKEAMNGSWEWFLRAGEGDPRVDLPGGP